MPRLAGTRASLVLAVAVFLPATGASPAGAQTQRDLALRAVPGRMLEAPRVEALATRLPVLVRVRVPAGTTGLRIRLGARNVTSRFRRARGSMRVANLTRADGLHYGKNHLSVLAQRGSRRPLIHARSFVLARRVPNLARVRLPGGPVTKLSVRVAGGVGLAARHFGQPGEVRRRLAVMRRERTVRLWLNGKRITRALDRSNRTRWTAELSATHGLRHGVNRLRMLVAEPDRGRFVLVRRRFVVPRGRHLAAAGWDVSSRVRGRVRLNGGRSRAARGGSIRHTWRIISKPRGSQTRLRGASSARPVLTPDRRGRYVIGLTVSDRKPGSRSARSSTDRVTLTSTPPGLLLPFVGGTGLRASWGVQVGDQFFEDYQEPSGRTFKNYMQFLTLDRATLTPVGKGNSWFDPAADPTSEHGLRTLAAAVSAGDFDQLVVLSRHEGVAPLRADQVDAFNDVIETLGVGRIDPGVLTRHQDLVIVGVPSGQPGSGWYTLGDAGWDVPGDRGLDNVLTGWLMPDVGLHAGGSFNYRLQPDRPVFDTSSSSSSTTNTMTLGDQHVTGTLSTASGGFHVVVFDPYNLDVVNNQVFATDGTADPKAGLAAMAKFLNDSAALGPHIAVQSIGEVENPGRPSSPYREDATDQAWRAVGSALTFYGANPHTFYNANGSYAFLGGPQLGRSGVVQSSSAIQVSPTPPVVRQPGTLRGRASMRGDGIFLPAVTQTPDAFQDSLYDIVFRPQTPWPYTAGGEFPQQAGCQAPGNDAGAYAAALSYVATGIHLPATPDLRGQYVTRDQDTWSDQKVDLQGLPYASGKGFTEAEFCNLKAQLQLEFDWLDNVKELFDAYKDAMNRSGAVGSADLQSIGKAIREAIGPSPGEQIVWSIGGFIGNMGSAAILGFTPDSTTVLAAWEALVTVYELGREVTSSTRGDSTEPVGDQIKSRADQLDADVASHLFDVANSLDRLRDVIISDPGRLGAIGPHTNDARWKVDPADTATRLRVAASAFFYTELMPIAYDTVWYLWPSSAAISNDVPQTADDCEGSFFTHPWRDAPATGQVDWRFDVVEPVFGPDRGGRSILGSGGLSGTYAPADLTNTMFGPVSKTKFGVYLPDFLWTKFEGEPTKRYQCQPG